MSSSDESDGERVNQLRSSDDSASDSENEQKQVDSASR